jgi:hypothetical protein
MNIIDPEGGIEQMAMKCAYHPKAEAVGRCVSCGRLVCAECKVELEGRIYCNPCANEIILGKKAAVEAPKAKDTASRIELAEITKAVKGFLTYTDEAVGFSISYPEKWERMSEEEDVLVGFEAPEAEYDVRANCVVVHEEVPSRGTLQSYFAKNKIDFQKQLKEYTPISEEELTIDGMPAIKHVFTFSKKKTTFKQMQIYLKQGKVGWVVGFTSVPETFNSHQSTFETIAASFHLFESSRGEEAKFVPSLAAMKKDIRGWAIALVIIGIIQVAVPLLDPWWGGVLIALGIMEFFVRHRVLYIVNGVAIIIAGIMNLVAAFGGGGALGGFAAIQFIWGANEIRKFFKYRSGPAKASRAPSTKSRAAGILSIVAGALSGAFWTVGLISVTVSVGAKDVAYLIIMVVLIIMSVLAIVGGVQACRGQRWGLALAGAICSLLFLFPLGIPAVILLAQSRRDFE